MNTFTTGVKNFGQYLGLVLSLVRLEAVAFCLFNTGVLLVLLFNRESGSEISFEMSLGLKRSIGRYRPEHRNFHYHSCEHLKS
jgi:hypothetical protein